jgi:hypothetical protein
LCYGRTGRWSKLHPQEHLFQYTPRTLSQIFNASGFDVLRIDLGKPFTPRSILKRAIKETAYWATRALKASTGIHLGGIEIIARVNRTAIVERAPQPARIPA